MSSVQLDYTEVVKRFSLKFPFLATLFSQLIFWVITYILFGLIIYFNTLGNNEVYGLTIPITLGEVVVISILIGFIYAFLLSIIDYLTDSYIEKLPLGVEVLFKAAIYLGAFSLIWFIGGNIWQELLEMRVGELLDRNVRYWFWGLFIYTMFSVLIISFIRQVNKSFGPGVLLPVLLGRYRDPVAQTRIFLFVDLSSSTSFAEKLGPQLYSELIQDCIRSANSIIPRFNAQIYQYVGDEIVLTWPGIKQSDYFNALGYFQSFIKEIDSRRAHFQEKYGLMPGFKAGLHAGSVVAAEVGTIKREIAYHGDAVITGARLETSCHFFQVPILISKEFVDKLGARSKLLFNYVADVEIKGKENPVPAYTMKDIECL